ncbi:MAG: tetratricopeptide repeat protein [Gemmatimonadota bacterium]
MTSRLEMVLELVAEHPGEPMPRYMAGNELLGAGDFAGAVAHLRRYIEMLPEGDVGAAYRLLARAHRALGDEPAARESFAEGIRAALAHGHRDLAEAIRGEIEG